MSSPQEQVSLTLGSPRFDSRHANQEQSLKERSEGKIRQHRLDFDPDNEEMASFSTKNMEAEHEEASNKLQATPSHEQEATQEQTPSKIQSPLKVLKNPGSPESEVRNEESKENPGREEQVIQMEKEFEEFEELKEEPLKRIRSRTVEPVISGEIAKENDDGRNEQGLRRRTTGQHDIPMMKDEENSHFFIPVKIPDEIVVHNFSQENALSARSSGNSFIISFSEAWKYAKSLDLTYEKRLVQAYRSEHMHWTQRLVSNMCISGKMPAVLMNERDQLIALSRAKLDMEDEMHFKMMFTIFRLLTGSSFSSAWGPHWERIGFQSEDPSADLRSIGLLGILQIVAFLTFYKDFLKKVFKYSEEGDFRFPLCVSLLAFSKTALLALEEGRLNGMIVTQRSVVAVLNNFYFAMFFKFFSTYKLNSLTIHDFSRTFEKVTDRCLHAPEESIDEFLRLIQNYGSVLFDE
eukprot:TRINITY_DN4194_c0_g1_i4.p1 TRINITY_DN4194_c0_g1~~TRINITY_DN4194_c0_g1_i4.p1  ORF type:complete len:463 (+),score=100.03 TRINITY_DN4194_c0_g1_i4:184-1572(+)